MLFKKTYDIEADSKDAPFAETVIDLTEPNVDPALPINVIDWADDPSDRRQGTDENDFATLTKEDDTFDAGDGNDVVHAGDGYDTVNGGAGDDFIYGGDGGGVLSGGAGNDVIRGGDNPNGGFLATEILYGGEGEDVLAGGVGDDILYGDQSLVGPTVPSSADTFVFDVKNWGRDTIADFDDGMDKIQFGGTSGVTDFEDLHIEEFTNKDGSFYTVISYQPPWGNPGDVNEIKLLGIKESDVDPDDVLF